ncbi:MAG: alpha/beta hydrolase [Acidimicrobiales bacterium]
MPIAPSNDIELYYETHGDPADPALLLVNGFSSQILGWFDGFREALAERGRFVISFDNRDVGLSTHLDGIDVDLAAIGAGTAQAPYDLSTFALDAVGLLDHLGVDKAHIAGSSMGGMIVQQMAIDHPDRVATLTSIMSTTGEPDYFQSAPEAMAALRSPQPSERSAFIERAVSSRHIFGSKRYVDDDAVAAQAGASFDRMYYPEGLARQTAAIRASGDRAEGLRKLQTPTLVIHGRDDTLILPSGGERTAELVPGANLLMLSDMGHDLPKPLWPLIVDAMISHSTHAIG